MKKNLLRVMVLAIVFIGLNAIKSQARIYTNDPTVNSGGTINITVSSQENVGTYNVSIVENTGVNFSSVSAPSGITAEKVGANGITGITTSGTTVLAYYTFVAPTVTTDTTYKVVFESNGLTDTNLNNIEGTRATATITVKAPATQTPTQEPTQNPTQAPEPTFSSVNETVYATTDVNVRSSYSTSSNSLGQLKKDESIVRTGVTTTSVNGYVWSKVIYNGQTGYIASNYLTTTKPETPATTPSTEPSEKPDDKAKDSTLKALSIKGVEIKPAFDPNTTSYTAIIKDDKTKVDVVAEVNSEKAKKEIVGNTDLKEGENLIVVTVTAEDGTVTNYQIKLIKDTQTAIIGFTVTGIKDNDERVKIALGEPTVVSENIIEYTVKLNEWLRTIEISKELENEKTYEGTGNFYLAIGENKFIVTEKGLNEEDDVTEYRIIINNPEKQVVQEETKKEEKKDVNYIRIAALISVAVIAIGIIVFLIIRYKKQNEIEYGSPDYSFLSEDDPNKEEKKPTIDDFYNTPENIEDDRGRRKGGKHF